MVIAVKRITKGFTLSFVYISRWGIALSHFSQLGVNVGIIEVSSLLFITLGIPQLLVHHENIKQGTKAQNIDNQISVIKCFASCKNLI